MKKLEERQMSNVKNGICHKLITCCFSPKHKGFMYLTDAINILVKSKQMQSSLQTQIYPIIAKKYNVSVNSVERNIRSSIDYAWDRYVEKQKIKPDKANRDNLLVNFYKKPTNRSFIYTYIVNSNYNLF